MCDTSSELSDRQSVDSGVMEGIDSNDHNDHNDELLPYDDYMSGCDSLYDSDIDCCSADSNSCSPSVTLTLNINTTTGLVLSTTKTTNGCSLVMDGRRFADDNECSTVIINGKFFDLRCERYAVLSYEQVCRLDRVMDEVVPIHGRGNFPTLEIKLKDLIKVVRTKLEAESVPIRDVRLNGGAASHVLSPENSAYNDLDLIFGVDLSNTRNFDKVRAAVLDSLLDFLPDITTKKRISSCTLKEAYVHKMVKVTEGDRWSLISLSNKSGRNVELKFVNVMKRQFEFSVDSFQIILDSLLTFYDYSKSMESMAMSDNFYPTVVGESVYGDFREALMHLQKKLIATRNPEEIRGGGLLKYCNLLVRNYKPYNPDQIKTLERYMCSRFFIDFSELSQQRAKLESYLANHFVGDEHMKYDYLMKLSQVVDESTVCLMGHERRQTLNLIEELAYYVYYQDQQRFMAKHQYETNPYIFSTTATGYFYTPYMPTHQTNCFNVCHCVNGWMTCMNT